MLTTSFKNYDEFKELFVRTKNDGTSARKNGILLSFLKSKACRSLIKEYGRDLSEFSTIGAVNEFLADAIHRESCSWAANRRWGNGEYYYCISIMGKDYYSDTYETDGKNGVCTDGDTSGYRYVNRQREGRVFKMKIGKMYRHLMDLTRLASIIPETVKLYLCEEMTRAWEAYTASVIPSDLVLHVDDDFQKIYSNRYCDGYFHSCMQGDTYGYNNHWKFYRDAVKAKAAYLTEGPMGPVVARCIVFTEVERLDTGEVIRVAERQYSRPDKDNPDVGDELLQRVLVRKLYDEGYIDAHKKTGAGCGEACAFIDKDGHDLSDVCLRIDCHLKEGDYLSYQDSFKWFDFDEDVAYNHDGHIDGRVGMLDETDDYFEGGGNYSEYHERYLPEDESCYVETREDYFWDDEVYYAWRWDKYRGRWYQEDCFEDDCILIDGEWFYAGYDAEYPRGYHLVRCPECDEWVPLDYEDGSACYSDITEEWYCCENCMLKAEEEYKRNNWAYSEYDDEYVEDEDDLMEIITEVSKEMRFTRMTILRETLEAMAERDEAVIVPGTNLAYATEVLETLAA